MSIATKNIYCISGLGADERAFERLSINGCSLHHVKWIAPLVNETLSSYAVRMSVQVKEKNPVLLGLSFGGMIAVEIAREVAVEKLILISSVKTSNEIPGWMRMAGMLRLHKFIPIKANRFTEKADDRRMGIETIEEKNFVDHYRKKADPKYIDWAIDQILNWRNSWVPENTFHIHGEHDRMFPIRNIQPTHIIKKGTHIMILNRAEEISACIEQIVSGKQ
jgi:pimeloyl-ACP methyl ester carboxylesterase